MNRNAAILASVSSVVLALALVLAWSWRGTASETVAATDRSTIAEATQPADGAAATASLVLEAAPSEPSRDGAASETSSPTATGERIDLREEEPVRPDGKPILAAGRVVDQDGSAVPYAHVVVVEPLGAGVPFGQNVAEGASDRQGHFEIRGEAEGFSLEARASKERYFDSKTATFTRGATELRLVIREGGVVAGRLILDPWVPASKIEVVVRPTSVPAGPVTRGSVEPRTLLAHLDRTGAFSQDGIAASAVQVAVHLEHDPWDAVLVEDVPVRDAREARDPRLDPIDLRGRFEPISVVVLDDRGVPVDGARVQLRGSETRDECSRITSGGRAEFLTRAGPHGIEIEKDGFRRMRLDGAYGDQVVRLRKGIAVRITLRGTIPRPPRSDRIAVALLRGTGRQMVLGGMGTFEDPKEAAFSVASPGAYEVAWYLDSGQSRKYLTGAPTRTVEVRDTDEPQEFQLEFPSEVLAAIK